MKQSVNHKQLLHRILKYAQCLMTVMLFTLALISEFATAQEIPLQPIPLPFVSRMVVPEARLPIRLQKIDVRADVLGTAAHTRIEMVFFNPNERVLEGELQFLLLAGQTVAGFALDINGELHPAVSADKTKDQQAFEDVSRARIDPALLEKTHGDNYKLRVYPLPAHGMRRVLLELDEILPSDSKGKTNLGVYYTTYRLPIQFAETIEQLDVAVHNAATPTRYSAMAVRARLGAERIRVAYASTSESNKELCSGSLVSFSRKNYAGKEILSIDYPSTEKF